MQIAHMVSSANLLHIAANFSSGVMCALGDSPFLEEYKNIGTQRILSTDGVYKGATPMRNAALCMGANEVILTPPDSVNTDGVVKWFKRVLTSKAWANQDIKFVLNPVTDDLESYWKVVFELHKQGLSTDPRVVAYALDAVSVCAMADMDEYATYMIRPSMVERLANQQSSKHLPVDLIEVGDRGGRELAEYRFVRAVRRVYTGVAERMTLAGYQMGIPTKGRRAISSTDFDLAPILAEWSPSNLMDCVLLSDNMAVLSNLAGT